MAGRETDILPSGITPEAVFLDRRRVLAGAAAIMGAGMLPGGAFAAGGGPQGAELGSMRNDAFAISDRSTSWDDVTSYNNFYEFGTDKGAPARYSGAMKARPWSIMVEGEVANPGRYDIEDLLKLAAMEERVYRMRCVEGWSMVIPWIGYPLGALIRRVEPNSHARYVTFETRLDAEAMVGTARRVIDWPYVEGLRMDEAMHPLTLLAFGLYGRVLPNQNGAPLRLVVPWKYGFKSAKSLVAIRFTRDAPQTSWMKSAPDEYGFYANVNPDVPHPRWSQATERRIGEDGFFSPKRKTLPFNGYGDQVAGLYKGMDLAKFY